MIEFPYRHVFNNAEELLRITKDGDFICPACNFEQTVEVVKDLLNTGCDFICLGCEEHYRVSRKKKEWSELKTLAPFYIWQNRKLLFKIKPGVVD